MLTWTFSSRRDHSASWYIAMITVVLSLVVYGIFQEMYLMSVVVFLFAGVYILSENNSAPETRVEITENYIQVGSTRYELAALATFSIVSIASIPSFLRVIEKRKFAPKIDIPLTSDINPQTLREFLSTYVEEDKDATLSNSDAIIHAMRL